VFTVQLPFMKVRGKGSGLMQYGCTYIAHPAPVMVGCMCAQEPVRFSNPFAFEIKDTANTAVLRWAGKTVALYEVGWGEGRQGRQGRWSAVGTGGLWGWAVQCSKSGPSVVQLLWLSSLHQHPQSTTAPWLVQRGIPWALSPELETLGPDTLGGTVDGKFMGAHHRIIKVGYS
jgi:hypothetical protein